MPKLPFKILMVILVGCLVSLEPCHAQKKKFDFKKGNSLLKKVKQYTEPEKKSPINQNEQTSETKSNESTTTKRKLTPPDVNEQITNARAAFADESYTESRFYVQQAIIGIELQIGHKILESMPGATLGNDADESQDVVYSSGAGFAGLNVSREYPGAAGSVKAMVANSSILNSSAQFAVSSTAMGSYDDNTKVTRYKGYKTMLEVDDYSGYTMSIPFGQSSVFILKCQICESEEQLLETADLFDIDEYKTLLGEK